MIIHSMYLRVAGRERVDVDAAEDRRAAPISTIVESIVTISDREHRVRQRDPLVAVQSAGDPPA